VLGFLPAVVHIAWAQVLLAQPQHARTNPLWVGLAGFASVALLGAGCAFALEFGWLGEQWRGVWPYLLPLVLWQGSACFAAAYSHLPFQNNNARRYSLVCITVAVVQGLVLVAPIMGANIKSTVMHFIIFCSVSATSLTFLAFFVGKIIVLKNSPKQLEE
jgi:hypothetical protein